MVDPQTLQPGSPLPGFAVGDIDRDRIVSVMEIMGDTNPIHENVELARSLGFRGLVNQGPANMAYVVNMLVAWTADPGSVRRLQFRFHDNVVPGDRLTARGTVTGVQIGDGESEIECDFRLENEDGAARVSGNARLLVAHV
jgi:acyl dehydratase